MIIFDHNKEHQYKKSMNTSTKIETLQEVKERQSMWLPWMEESIKGLTLTSLVETTTKVLPFGRYLLSITPVD
jgi:hypothetical protein